MSTLAEWMRVRAWWIPELKKTSGEEEKKTWKMGRGVWGMGDGRVRAPTKHVRLQQLNGLGFLSAERETIADADNASGIVPQRRFSEHLF